MSEARFKTMRHIEAVRGYIGGVIRELTHRSDEHDQSKMAAPEVEIFEVYTPKLRDSTYGSEEYKTFLKEMEPALTHHYAENRHHPEHFKNGIQGMTLLDMIEMLCDWKAATMRHADGDIMKSIEINQKRYGYGDDIKAILIHTAMELECMCVSHKANES